MVVAGASDREMSWTETVCRDACRCGTAFRGRLPSPFLSKQNRGFVDVTVVICTYNGADRVPDVLDHLRMQEEMGGAEWEVLVIDNNSTDGTVEVVRKYREETWDRPVALRVHREQRQGAAFARQRGLNEAKGRWVAFIDDDNLPARDWVAAACRFGEAHPQAGAFGGQIHGRFQEDPPKSFGLVKPLFALNDRTETVCYSAGDRLQFGAPGAGLVVRKAAWEESMPETGPMITGPTGDSRGTLGEEFELQWHLYQNDWEIWHNPEMHLEHKIPASRFEKSYLERFFTAIGLSRHRTRMMRFEPWQRPFATVAFWLNDLRKLVALYWRYCHKLNDRFVQGRMQVLKMMLFRPFPGSDKYGR